MQDFNTRGQGKFSSSEAIDRLCFLNTTISGLNMEILFETMETHIFVSE
jgi:hypothetical protein